VSPATRKEFEREPSRRRSGDGAAVAKLADCSRLNGLKHLGCAAGPDDLTKSEKAVLRDAGRRVRQVAFGLDVAAAPRQITADLEGGGPPTYGVKLSVSRSPFFCCQDLGKVVAKAKDDAATKLSASGGTRKPKQGGSSLFEVYCGGFGPRPCDDNVERTFDGESVGDTGEWAR
jgi:hypothetical protein